MSLPEKATHAGKRYVFSAYCLFDKCGKSAYYCLVRMGAADGQPGCDKALENDGWYKVDQVGSDKQFKQATKKGTRCRIRNGISR